MEAVVAAPDLPARVTVLTAALPRDLVFALEAYESLCRQEPDWEWVVQLDGRGGAVPAALRADARVHVRANSRRIGPAATRNRALARSSGALVANLDIDDQLLPGALSALSAALAAHPTAAFAFGDGVDLNADGTLVRFPATFPPGLVGPGAIPARWRSEADDYWVPIHPAGIMWRRRALLALGGWTALWAMDDTALLMAASTLMPAVAIAAETFLYRKRAGQLSEFHPGAHGRRREQIAFIRQRIDALSDLRERGLGAI